MKKELIHGYCCAKTILNIAIQKIADNKGEDPDGGGLKWLISLGVAVGVLALIFAFLKGFMPTFLEEIFNKVRTFFA